MCTLFFFSRGCRIERLDEGLANNQQAVHKRTRGFKMNRRNHIMEPDELMAYLDGELGAKESSRAAAHLDKCEQCQKIAAELRDVSQFLAGWQTEPFEANLVESVSSLPPTTANSEIKNRNASLLDRTKWLRV